MITRRRAAAGSRARSRTGNARRPCREPADGAAPTETFFRAGRVAAVRDTDGTPVGRAVSAVLVWALMYGLLVTLTIGLGAATA